LASLALDSIINFSSSVTTTLIVFWRIRFGFFSSDIFLIPYHNTVWLCQKLRRTRCHVELEKRIRGGNGVLIMLACWPTLHILPISLKVQLHINAYNCTSK